MRDAPGSLERLGLLEGTEDAATELQRIVDRLHSRRELGKVVVAEVGLAGAPAAMIRRVDTASCNRVRASSEVTVCACRGRHVRHVAEQDLRVLLISQDEPGRWGDLALGDDARGHLVQQRLEQVMRRARNQLDVDIGPLQLLGREFKPPNPDPMMTTLCRSVAVAPGWLIAAPRVRKRTQYNP